jgi:hypothetical protein
MLPLLIVWGAWTFRSNRPNLIHFALLLLSAGLTLAPWTARNYLVFEKIIPFSTTAGSALLQGNNRLVVIDPALFGYSVWDTAIPEYREALQSAGDEVTRDDRAKQFAIAWLRDNPNRWSQLVWHKFIRSWTPFLSNNPSAIHRWVYLLSWGPVLLLFGIGFLPTLWQSLRDGTGAWLIHMAILHYVMNSVLFFANIRYRAPVDPLCILLAAWTVCQAWSTVSGARTSPLSSEVDSKLA